MSSFHWARTFTELERKELTRKGLVAIGMAIAGALVIIVGALIVRYAVGSVGQPFDTLWRWAVWVSAVAACLLAALGGLAIAVANGLLNKLYRGFMRLRSQFRRGR